DDEMELSQSKKNVEELIERLRKLGGGYQQMLFDDFEQEKEDLQKMIEQKSDLTESEKDIRRTIDKINEEARERFLKTFEQIREKTYIHRAFIRVRKNSHGNCSAIRDLPCKAVSFLCSR